MGLVTRRSLQLDKMFDQFAVDPKNIKKKPTDSKEPKTKVKDSTNKDKKK